MNEGVIAAIISLLSVPAGILVGWLLNRKRNVSDIFKNITESSNLSVDASQAAVELMQTTMETLSNELKNASDEIVQLKKEIVELRHQNLLLLQENHSLHAKIDELVLMVNTGEIPAVPPLPDDPFSGPAS